MTIWKSKDELPEFDREFLEVYKDNSKSIDKFMSESKAREYYLSTPYNLMPSFTVCRELDDDVVKWCYLDDLLALEQRLEKAKEGLETISGYERAGIGSGGGAIPIPTEEAEIAIETLEIINKE